MIGDAFNHFINEIEIQKKETSFKNNWFLNGNASYLYEMLFDLSSFTGFFYAYKRDEYARYDGAKRLENIKVINPDSYLLFLGNRGRLYEYLKQEHISYSPPCDLLKSV